MRAYSSELIEEIKSRYSKGEGIPQIARELGLSNPGIQKYIKQAGLSRSFVKARELVSRQMKNYDFFNIIDTEEKAYWLGFVWADGCPYQYNMGGYKLCFALHKKDGEHVKKFADLFDAKVRISKETIITEIGNRLLVESLWEKGVVPHRCYDDDFTTYEYVPDNLMQHFIRGIFDGDGAVFLLDAERGYDKKIYYYIRTSFVNSLPCIYWIGDFLSDHLDIPFPKIWRKAGGNCYEIKWSNYDSIKLLTWLYLDVIVWLPRKRKLFEDFLERCE